MKRLNLIKSNKITTTDILKDSYKAWRNFRSETKDGHYILPNGFNRYLPLIHTGAINLYLFYCLHAKNDTGESWYSIETLSNELDISTKSIANWNKQLESLGLIYREKDGKGSITTFLLPITDFIIEVEDDINDYIGSNHSFDGDLVSILHIFKWISNDGKSKTCDIPKNLVILCYQREYEANDKNLQVRKFVIFEPKELNNLKPELNCEEFREDIYLTTMVKNEFKVKTEFDIKGVAINPKFNLRDKKELLGICQDLVDGKDLLKEGHFETIELK